jgi:hypothetical protein
MYLTAQHLHAGAPTRKFGQDRRVKDPPSDPILLRRHQHRRPAGAGGHGTYVSAKDNARYGQEGVDSVIVFDKPFESRCEKARRPD